MENSARGLTLLEPDHKVVVTGEEHHRPALAGYAPRADGRSRRVAVELGFVAVRGGGRAIEVRLDGLRVGQLTPLMSQRYGPLVDDVLRRGERPGAVALVIDGRRGVEVELRLPDAPAGSPAPPPAPRPPGRPPNPGPDTGRPAGRRRGRTPLLVGGGVLALLLAVGAAVGGGDDRTATNAAPSIPTVRAVSPTTVPATTTPTTTINAPTTTVTPDVDEAAVPAAVPPATRTRTADPTTQSVLAAPVEPEPEPQPEPEPEPDPEPQPRPQPAAASSGCHPSYSPCVPDGPDLDCGDLDGPYAVSGPDTFRLDADNDGVGCE